jgi:hypothetical protein
MSDKKHGGQYTPDDFEELFSAAEEPIIVGGQAVNVWASYYAPRSPELSQAAVRGAFTSKDADVFMPTSHVISFTNRTKWKFLHFSDTTDPIIGILSKQEGEKELTADVLRRIIGLEWADIRSVPFRSRSGMVWQVLHPVSVLRAKLANLVELGNRGWNGNLVRKDARGEIQLGDWTQRHDDEHAKQMVHACRYYFEDLAEDTSAGVGLSEEMLVDEFIALLKVVDESEFQRVAKEFGINLGAAVPFVDTKGIPMLAEFYNTRFGPTRENR